MTKTVFVTGATGFIAKHLVLQLLNKGYHVIGSARSTARRTEIVDAISPHLETTDNLDARLRVVQLDLNSDEGWQDALVGADVLMHTASPFPLEEPQIEDDLIKPAVEGTLRALRAAKSAGVSRVVLTSSVASIMATDLPADQTKFDERNWSDTSGPRATAYGKSKTLAERAAWDFVASEAPEIRLTTINPGFVLGPTLDAKFGSSMIAIERLLSAKDPALPDISFTVVDARDVAKMHILAAETDASAGLRIAAVSDHKTFVEMAGIIKAHLPDRKIVTRQAPNFLIRFLGLFDKQIKALVSSLGRRDQVSNDRAIDVLGVTFLSATKSISDAADSVLEFGNGS